MASPRNLSELHFVLLPFLAHGHMIPIVDMAKLLALAGVHVTVITTHLNATRFDATIRRAAASGLRIQLLRVNFPSAAVGLPEGCENMDSLPSRSHFQNLLAGVKFLQQPVEDLLGSLRLRPACVISDKNIAWSHETAGKFEIPRIVFDGTSCFSLLCTHNILESRIHETVIESEPFVVPGLPDRIELTRLQLPASVTIGPPEMRAVREEIREKELAAYGVVVNTFEELEGDYVKEYRKIRGERVWCIGPVSLSNRDESDKAERGNRPAIDETECLNWLDSQRPGSVLYVCLGSQSRLTSPQLIEIGLGLESSNVPFVWVIRDSGNSLIELEKWVMEEKFEKRIEGRGLLIKGWAPQVLILAHTAIGGFLTHCGWNSTLEGISAGVPMATWPMFAEQFYNEKFVVEVLRIGIGLGVRFAVKWGEEERYGAVIGREDVRNVVEKLMDGGKESEERKRRAMKLGEMATKAIEEGGSSYLNLRLLIQHILVYHHTSYMLF